MAKSSGIVHVLLLLVVFLVKPDIAEAQPMPETLDMNWLLSQPKYRNIHHDSFCRTDNANEIGNNAKPERPKVMAYKTFSEGRIRVGIRNNCATNFEKRKFNGRCIKYIEAGRKDFHLTAVRTKETGYDIKTAFFIKDINNFYIVCLNEDRYEVIRYLNGNRKRVAKGRHGGERLEVSIDGNDAEIMVDGKYQKTIRLREWSCDSHLCGIAFENNSVSKIDDFIVDYRDTFEDAGIDAYVERGEVEKPAFGSYCAEKGVCTASNKFISSGKNSYRFILKQPTQAQVKANRDRALHSTIMLDGIKVKGGNNFAGRAGGNKPLDSYVFTVDVLFPNQGEENWALDELYSELIIQEHHVGYNIPFSPSFSINIKKGRLYLNNIWMEHIARGTNPSDNILGQRSEFIGRINNDDEELYLSRKGYDDYRNLPYLEKGAWHNITMYVKLGYNQNQDPRTVVYIDGVKVADWDTPNAYNCQEYGEYLEFGIYKWDWNTQEKRDKTPIQRRVIYFDNIHYYI